MQTSDILASINEEIGRLQQVRELLVGNDGGRVKRGRKAAAAATSFAFGSNGLRKSRTISAAGRARIAAAQRARWAKLKKGKAEKK